MLRFTGAALALGIVAALTGGAPASAREQSPKCYPERAEEIKTGTRARLFETVDDDDSTSVAYACDLLTGRRTRLAEWAFDEGVGFTTVRFAGRMVAFTQSSCVGRTPTPVVDPCQEAVRVLDVQTRRERSAAVDAVVEDLVVLPSGAAAWIERRAGDPPRVVRAMAPDGRVTELDSGQAIAAGSLALAGDTRAYWLNGAQVRSAQVGNGPPEPTRYAGPEPRGKRACFPSRSETIAASRRIRLYQRFSRNDDEITYALCDLRSGRRTKIITVLEPDEPFSIFQVRLAGTFAAMSTRECSKYGCAGPRMRVIDVTGAAAPLDVSVGGEGSWVFDVALRANGSVAWIWGDTPDAVSPGRTRELRRCDAAGCAVLDTGGDLGMQSLGLSEASDLYWTKGGEPRSAALR